MSHLLPPQGHPARDMFEVTDLVAIATRQVAPTFLCDARRSARALFERNPAARRAIYIIMRSDNDQLELVSFGRRLGRRVEWRFGGGLARAA